MKAFRAFLESGRVVNLPTVWSNVLAGWAIAGGVAQPALVSLAVGASLLYLCGTVWNDAFDVGFDRRHRPERPVPSGRLPLWFAWSLGGVFLVAGVAVLLLQTRADPFYVLLLAGAIIFYDYIHKRSPVGVWFMGACRALLYFVAATAAAGAVDAPKMPAVAIVALATGLYVVGLSVVAKGEATGAGAPRWALALLGAPVLLAGYAVAETWSPLVVMFSLVLVVWIAIVLAGLYAKGKPDRVPTAVGRMLAGIMLIDAMVISVAEVYYLGADPVLAGGVLVAFALTLLLQKVLPAT